MDSSSSSTDPTRERDQRTEAISKVILAKDVTLMQMDKLSAQIGENFAKHAEVGVYQCARCGNSLFDSDQKMISDRYPTFRKSVSPNAIKMYDDFSYGMARTAVSCKKCSLPLGHVFKEGKAKDRFVVLSCAMKFAYIAEEQGGATSRSLAPSEPSRFQQVLPWVAVPTAVVAILIGLWLYKRSTSSPSSSAPESSPTPPPPPSGK